MSVPLPPSWSLLACWFRCSFAQLTRWASPLADGGEANLTSDRTYHWRVRSYPGPTAWANASFSTALLEQADWAKSRWIQSPGGSNPGQFASQMRKVFTLPEGVVTRGRIFLALPGYGEVSVNGRRVDDPDTGSRMLSQYDVRMLYVRSHTVAFLCFSQIHPRKHCLNVRLGGAD